MQGRLCKKCNLPIEPARPKQARYCLECGARRSPDWKQEHPERVARYDNDASIQRWRDKRGWSNYVHDWRDRNRDEYREQNRQHVRQYRARQRQQDKSLCETTLPSIQLHEEIRSEIEAQVVQVTSQHEIDRLRNEVAVWQSSTVGLVGTILGIIVGILLSLKF
jgi:hypothetical protein